MEMISPEMNVGTGATGAVLDHADEPQEGWKTEGNVVLPKEEPEDPSTEEDSQVSEAL